MKVGFIGLGKMGAPMARNLLKNGVGLTVADLDPKAISVFTADGVKAAATLSEPSSIDLLFLSLPDEQVVGAALFGEDGIAAALKPGCIVVDTSTIDYAAAIDLAARLAEQNVAMLDAPVSGMETRAIDGTLTIMCGGDEAAFETALPFLKHMGNRIVHMGGPGKGQLTKLVNQLLYNINMAAVAEVLPMAVALGLDAGKIGAVINSGTGRSHASETFIPRILERNFEGTYPLGKAYKDMVTAAGISARDALPMPVLAAATATYQTALRNGHGGKGKGSMALVFEELLDVTCKTEHLQHKNG